MHFVQAVVDFDTWDTNRDGCWLLLLLLLTAATAAHNVVVVVVLLLLQLFDGSQYTTPLPP